MGELGKTVKTVLEASAQYLAQAGVENPRIAAELLLGRLLECKRLDLYLRFDTVLSEKKLEAMRRGVKRVADGEPVQYIIGQTEFMGHAMKVDSRALIPRPETESLVQSVLDCSGLWDGAAESRPIVVDVGTGSGCIAVSLALSRPEGVYVALDTSADALELGVENAAAHGLEGKVAFVRGELSDCVEPETISAVVSNPPYIATAEVDRLPGHIRDHEPREALDGGASGLAVVEILIQDAAVALVNGGFLFVEIGDDQGERVRSLLADAGFADIEVRKDLADKDRVACGRLA